MLERVKRYIEENKLLFPKEKVLVGVSGGADSVALLDMLYHLGYHCIICHCNFHLRADESLRDEHFVHALATSYQLPFIKTDFDTQRYAKEKNLSIEMAARELRYTWFEEKRQEYNASAIAVGHHLDDSVETTFLNLCRGTGIRGLTGIRAKNGNIVRPLLTLSKKDILTYLSAGSLSFVTDSTNEDSIYTRNFIRNKIIPLFEELNPDFNQTMQRTQEYLTDTEAIYRQAVEYWKSNIVKQKAQQWEIAVPVLLSSPAPSTILFEILSPFGFNSAVIKDISGHLTDIPGKTFYNSDVTYRVILHRDCLILSPNKKATEDPIYLIEENTSGISLPISLRLTIQENSPDFCFNKKKETAYFDLEKLAFPLILRHWKKGDRFVPFGMKGKKKLSDYFTDRKMCLPEKEMLWILCNAKDEILWIVGERADNRFRVTETTRDILRIDFFPDKGK
ncbi:MAG: tRNA lysidine(34) synthetase TilS [Candidatus Azobacteroides sp.]|nr:tRNA lysidine(34) synthetase TilS [Candidatus Azobacteroides sp.]